MDHCERYIILYATKLLEISLNFIDANREKIKNKERASVFAREGTVAFP